jgi:hypothetical protein
MVGQGVLLECLDHLEVSGILAVGRSSCGIDHPKLQELLHQDFFDYSPIESDLTGYDACFFCLGVSAAGMSEEQYNRLTYELTLSAAGTLVRLNPSMTFCYVSGAGTDSSESGLLQLPFKAAYMFRPGYIQPLKGIRSKTKLYQTFYTLARPLYPALKTLFPGFVTTTEKVGVAMIKVALHGYPQPLLENRDINALAS